MVIAKPHFLLFCDAHVSGGVAADTAPLGGRWHFVLERLDVAERLEAADGERLVPRERLALLAVVRGLEALEQPSQVTLVTTSRYVSRGLRYGLTEWREANYSWEHFGIQKPIRNADLWQRIDCALRYHEVACRLLESSLAQGENERVPELDELEAEASAVPATCFPRIDSAAAAAALPATPVFGSGSPVAVAGLPSRAVASVRHVERPCSAGPLIAAWWSLAVGWLQWWRGRVARPSLLAGI